MKRNSKAALKSVPKSHNGIVIAQTGQSPGSKTYSTAAAGPSRVVKSLPNGSVATADAPGNALPLVKLNKKNGSALGSANSDPGEATVLDDSKIYVVGNSALDLRKRNGISMGNGQEGKPKKQTDLSSLGNHVEDERWLQRPVSTGAGDTAGVPCGSAIAERKPDQPAVDCAVPVRNNEPKRMVADNKWTVAESAQKQNVHELRPVKILQRPASVAKCQTPERNPELDPFGSSSPQERKHREKCLSLNMEEREHLENLIENLIISCVDNEDDSSGDETGPGIAPRMIRRDVDPRPGVTLFPGKSPGRAEVLPLRAASSGSSGASKSERDSRSETPKGIVGRTETGGKGRKFVREMSGNKNAGGRGRDQGKRRETLKAKDNRKTSDFQQKRPNEEPTRQAPQQENLQERQDMMSADVYPAQLKVAIKHMDALPPRFLRRIQNGKGGIGGSEPTLPMDDRSETSTSPEEDLKVSSSTGKDLDKFKQSKKQGVKNMIRNFLNNMDDDEGIQVDTCARKLSFSLGAIGGHRDMKAADSSIRDAFMSAGAQSSDVNADGAPTTLALFSNGFNPFQMKNGLLYGHPGEGFPPHGSGTVAPQGLKPSTDFRNYSPYAGEQMSAYNGFQTTAAGAMSTMTSKKASFSVNAPEFVSKFYEQNSAVVNNARENDTNVNLLRGYGSLNANEEGNQYNCQDQMFSNVPTVRNNMIQPEYFGSVSQPCYPPLSSMPAAPRDVVPAYATQDAYSKELVAGHGPANADLLQSIRMMQYGARGYLHPQHQMQMLQQQLSQQQLRLSHQQLQQLSQQQQQQLLNQQQLLAQQQQLLNQQQQQQLLSQQQQQQLLTQQMLPQSQLNQQALLGGGGIHPPVTGNQAQMPWFPGNQDAYPSGVSSRNGLPLQPLPFDIGRQMLMKLMCEGQHVMVILVGRVDDNKLSLIRYFHSYSVLSFTHSQFILPNTKWCCVLQSY